MPSPKLILVTGATGYVGGRLVPRLLEAGYRVRVLVRDPARLRGRKWLDQVEVVTGDALQPETLTPALKDVSIAYYLIHGMQAGKDNADRDLRAAHNFAEAASRAEIDRIIYLGELVDPASNLSPYLRARHETGHILRDGRVPVTEFRAGMIVGSGSVLFEMIRYLTERLPVMVCPAWFFSQGQPIAIRDVLSYLMAAIENPDSIGRLIEIGGPTRLTYADMLREYARVRGLKRYLIGFPMYAPRLAAYWVHMVTPIHWRVVLPLIEGLRDRLIVRDETAKKLFPQIQPVDFRTAVLLALGRIQRDNVETSWSDALVIVAGDDKPYTFTVEEGMFIETRQVLLDLEPEAVYRAYMGLGGERGWMYMDWAFGVRGWMDKVIGGVGLQRGRRHPDEIRVGEAVDYWRVEEVEPDRRLLLRAEMKIPGKSWFEFKSEPRQGKTLFTINVYFASHGLPGFLYWYAFWIPHQFLLNGMIRRISSRAHLLAHRAPLSPPGHSGGMGNMTRGEGG